jgi:hypothetical protein
MALTSSSSSLMMSTTTSFAASSTSATTPPAGLEEVVRCENGQWVLIAGSNPQKNQIVIIPQNTNVVRSTRLV